MLTPTAAALAVPAATLRRREAALGVVTLRATVSASRFLALGLVVDALDAAAGLSALRSRSAGKATGILTASRQAASRWGSSRVPARAPDLTTGASAAPPRPPPVGSASGQPVEKSQQGCLVQVRLVHPDQVPASGISTSSAPGIVAAYSAAISGRL
jgi:hypothetical protein